MADLSSIWPGPALPPLPLPPGLTERQISSTAAGLSFHIIEAGRTAKNNKPLLLLLHGFPELAYSWRKVMPALASAGFYVVAVDQRGYGRTTGWDTSSFEHVNLAQFSVSSLVRDVVALVYRLGYNSVRCVVGHDFGAVTAASCALLRPDLFTSVVTMSHPFKPPPALPFDTADEATSSSSAAAAATQIQSAPDINQQLAQLDPPRKHYKWYNSTAAANVDWCNPPQGMHAFLRGYMYLKSADWSGNQPYQLTGWTATELARMPEYYVMRLEHSMPEAVAANTAGEDIFSTRRWLDDDELDVYVQEWSRTGFQGGLNWYRSVQTNATPPADVQLLASAKILVPSTFVTGAVDWGNYQQPGAMETLHQTCTDFRGIVLIPGAGHWPQQEQPEKVVQAILEFVEALPPQP